MFDDVCRLCMGTKDLLWIFDDKMAKNMTEIIEVTSGVQICKTDAITQMVCSTCCQITIKMFKFRTTSIKNDKDLKAKCAGYNILQLTNSGNKKEVLTSTTDNTVSSTSSNSVPAASPPVKLVPDKYSNAHPSIKEIVRKYPNIKLLRIPKKAHFGAYITLLTDEVDDWFKEKNYTDSEIQQIKKRAVEYTQTQTQSPVVSQQAKKRKLSCDSTASTKTNDSDKTIIYSYPTNKQTKINNQVTIKPVERPNLKPTTELRDNNAHTKIKINVEEEKKIKVTEKTSSNKNNKDKMKLEISQNLNGETEKTPSNKNNKDKIKLDIPENLNKKRKRIITPKAADNLARVNKSKKESKVEKVSNPETKSSKLSSTKEPAIEEKNKPSSNQTLSNKSNKTVTKTNHEQPAQPEVTEIEAANTKQKEGRPECRPIAVDQDYSLFTSRPFLRESKYSKTKSIYKGADGIDCFILSDSDDDVVSNNSSKTDSANRAKDTVVISDSDIPSDSHSSSSSVQSANKNSEKENSKSNFVKSLELAPKEATNTPDLSLLSVSDKMNTLYICTVCDSHHSSRKELKLHKRRMHTKCPFCNKKFRNLESRDEHVKNKCVISTAPKRPKLALVRVDEIEEIRKKYASAFEAMEDESEETMETESATLPSEIQEAPSSSQRKDPPPSSSPVPSTSPHPKETAEQAEKPDAEQAEKPDSEKATTEQVKKTSDEQMDANEKYIAETIDAVQELERFLATATSGSTKTNKKKQSEEMNNTAESISSNCGDIICISDDEANTDSTVYVKKMKITNNELLKEFNLHDDDTSVLSKIVKAIADGKSPIGSNYIHSVKDNPIIDGSSAKVKIFKNLRKHLQQYKIPIEISYRPDPRVGYKYYRRNKTSAGNFRSDWFGMQPKDIKKYCSLPPPQPPLTNILKSPLPVSTSTINTSPPVLNNPSTSVITSTASVSNELQRQVNVTPFVNESSDCPPNSHHVSLITTGSLINAEINRAFSTDTPVVLNSPEEIGVYSKGNNIAKIILLPNTVVTAEDTSNVPATQGPLPVIQSVSSATELQELTKKAPSPVMNQPTIRVKSLSELS